MNFKSLLRINWTLTSIRLLTPHSHGFRLAREPVTEFSHCQTAFLRHSTAFSLPLWSFIKATSECCVSIEDCPPLSLTVAEGSGCCSFWWINLSASTCWYGGMYFHYPSSLLELIFLILSMDCVWMMKLYFGVTSRPTWKALVPLATVTNNSSDVNTSMRKGNVTLVVSPSFCIRKYDVDLSSR